MAIYTIQFNAITLHKAAHYEKKLKKKYADDACKITMEIKKANQDGFLLTTDADDPIDVTDWVADTDDEYFTIID